MIHFTLMYVCTLVCKVMSRNCDKKECNFALLLPEIQELRRNFFLRSLKHISCLHCHYERSKCSPVAVTHSVRW